MPIQISDGFEGARELILESLEKLSPGEYREPLWSLLGHDPGGMPVDELRAEVQVAVQNRHPLDVGATACWLIDVFQQRG